MGAMNSSFQRQVDILEIFTDARKYVRDIPRKQVVRLSSDKTVRLPSLPTRKNKSFFYTPIVTNSDLYDIHLQLQLKNNPRINSK